MMLVSPTFRYGCRCFSCKSCVHRLSNYRMHVCHKATLASYLPIAGAHVPVLLLHGSSHTDLSLEACHPVHPVCYRRCWRT